MRAPLRERIGFWLERWEVLHPWLFAVDGYTPNGRVRLRNRINGHIIIRAAGWTPPESEGE